MASEAITSAPGCLPDHILALPKEDPNRIAWERDYRQKDDGSWYKAAGTSHEEGGLTPKQKKMRRELLIALGICLACVMAIDSYRNALQDVRDEIVSSMRDKGYSMRDPGAKAIYREAKMTLWLPSLKRMLVSMKGTPRKRTEIELVGNPEEGSYIDYIQRHGYPFDERDALEWQSRSSRPVTPSAQVPLP